MGELGTPQWTATSEKIEEPGHKKRPCPVQFEDLSDRFLPSAPIAWAAENLKGF